MRILVAGIGNVLYGDDGFGPAVAAALRARALPPHVAVGDYGIRGMDLALALTAGLDAAILVDAVARGGPPGTLYAIEPTLGGGGEAAAAAVNAHALDPASVLALTASLGTPPRLVRIVGCEPAPATGEEPLEIGLSAPVAQAIAPAVAMVDGLVDELVAALTRELAGEEATCTS